MTEVFHETQMVFMFATVPFHYSTFFTYNQYVGVPFKTCACFSLPDEKRELRSNNTAN
jgi:hypothetical protein